MNLSVIIPAHDEEDYIGRCLESVRTAEKAFGKDVQVVVALNRCTDATERMARDFGAEVVHEDARCMARIRNAAAARADGDTLVTIDADSWMTPNLFLEVERLLKSGRYVGGGTMMLPERFSFGMMMSGLTFVPRLVAERLSAGLFWCRKEDFDALGGFNEDMVSVEDVDFARRLKAYGKTRGRRYTMIWRAHITTSCRKLDRFGDWFLIKDPGFVKRVFTGRDVAAADRLYYDFERPQPPPYIVLREAVRGDAEAFHDLHTRAIQTTCRDSYTPEQRRAMVSGRTAQGYFEGIDAGEMFTALIGPRVVGFGHASPGEVQAVYVHPEAQGLGVGSRLLGEAVDRARQGSSGPMALLSTLNAVGFYERHGFGRVEATTHSRGGVELPAVRMSKVAR